MWYRLMSLALLCGLLAGPALVAAQDATPAGSVVTPGNAPFSYTLTDLGTLGGERSYGYGISPDGDVVGSANTSDGQRPAALWHNGQATNLGTLGGKDADANDVNDAGQVVGISQIADGTYYGFIWDQGAMTQLGTSKADAGFANAINFSGEVVGQAWFDSHLHAADWIDGKVSDLGTLGGSQSEAFDVNASGAIVGVADDASGVQQPTEWTNGKATILTGLGGTVAETGGDDTGEANAISELGSIAGWAATEDGVEHACYWFNGTPTDLGGFNGGPSEADDINNVGEIVGSADTGGSSHGVLWTAGSMFDLNLLIAGASEWEVTGARAINDAGQISGIGKRDDVDHAILLTPVKEREATPVSPPSQAVASPVPSASSAAAWSGDPGRTGEQPGPAPTGEPDILWQFATNAKISAAPIVGDGTVYAATEQGDVFALDEATGAKRWRVSGKGQIDRSPALAGGILYVTSVDTPTVYAFDAATGTLRWAVNVASPVGSPPIVAGGLLYLVLGDRYDFTWAGVMALDAETGATRWTHQFDPSLLGGQDALGGGTLVVVATNVDTNDESLVALDADTGSERWQTPAASYFELDSTPVVAGASAYMFDGNALTQFDLQTGQPSVVTSFDFSPMTDPAIANGFAYATSFELSAIDLTSGESADLGISADSQPPVVVGDTIVVIDVGSVEAVSTDPDAPLLWEVDSPSFELTAPAVVDGMVFVCGDDGVVYAIG